jgi:hypothetical protein
MSDPGHQIASEAAKRMMRECLDAGLTWTEIAVACESFVVIMVSGVAVAANTPDPPRFAQEIIDTITERAHARAQDYLRSRG